MSKYLKSLVDTISSAIGIATNKIEEVISENKDYLDVEQKLAKEHKEGIEALKEYGNVETPSLKDAMNSLAGMYETVAQAREEKVEELQQNFISPMNELLEKFKTKKKELEEAEDAKKDYEKAQKKLDKLESKPEEKQKPEKISAAKVALEEAKKKYEKEEAEAKKATEKFNKEKLETMKSVLSDLTEAEKKFHQKALGLLETVRKKAEAIDVEKESKISEEKADKGEKETEKTPQ